MIWTRAHCADPFARDIADRHYNRQSVGHPQIAPPGRALVLKALTPTGRAFWITSWPLARWVKHAWAGAWVCSAFRNEGAGCASGMIVDAVAATRSEFGAAPDLGMVTFVNRDKVRPTLVRGRPVWGWCFRKAGFQDAGETEGGLLALRLSPERMPPPREAVGAQGALFGARAEGRAA